VRILDVRDERSVVGGGRTAIVVLHIRLAQRSQSQSAIIYCNKREFLAFQCLTNTVLRTVVHIVLRTVVHVRVIYMSNKAKRSQVVFVFK